MLHRSRTHAHARRRIHEHVVWKILFLFLILLFLLTSRTAIGARKRSIGEEPTNIGEVIREQREQRKAERELAAKPMPSPRPITERSPMIEGAGSVDIRE